MTLSATLTSKVLAYGAFRTLVTKGGHGEVVKRCCNGSDIFIGALVTDTGETFPDIDLVGSTEPILGVVIGPSPDSGNAVDLDKDSDDPYADNTYVMVYIPEKNDELLLVMYTNTAGTKNEHQKIQDGTGMLGGDFAYGNTAEATDTLIDSPCVLLETISATGSTEKICLVRWK